MPFYLYKIIKIKKRNNLLNYLKIVRPIVSLKNIQPETVYRMANIFVKLFLNSKECLVVNGLSFTILKKYFYSNIKLALCLKKDNKNFTGHCYMIYQGRTVMQDLKLIEKFTYLYEI